MIEVTTGLLQAVDGGSVELTDAEAVETLARFVYRDLD